jgi:hypothetical protein
MNLTANFSLHEMTKSETALRKGMPNEPTEADIANLKLLAEKEQIVDGFMYHTMLIILSAKH